MRHGKYGLTTAIALTDDEIKTQLPKDALVELEKEVKGRKAPVTYIIQEAINLIDPGTEFTVIDMFLMIHTNEEIRPDKSIKMHTLRTTLSTMSRKEESGIEVASKASKIRLYRKVSEE